MLHAKIEHCWTPTWWNCRVNSFLPIVHWDTFFNGISKAVWFRTSKQIVTPLNSGQPQFHPFTLNSFSKILFLYVWVKNHWQCIYLAVKTNIFRFQSLQNSKQAVEYLLNRWIHHIGEEHHFWETHTCPMHQQVFDKLNVRRTNLFHFSSFWVLKYYTLIRF